MKRTFFVIMFLCIACISNAANINLNDCSQSTVQTSINSSTDGDTIVCPAGSWTWGSRVSWPNKSVTLQGAGIDTTIISLLTQNIIEVQSSYTKSFRITGFTFKSLGNFGGDTGIMLIRGTGWRIDHNKFQMYSNQCGYNGGSGIRINAGSTGVIDHNEFRNDKSRSTAGTHASIYISGPGDISWGWDSQIGTGNNTVFIEDNIFEETMLCTDHNSHAAYGGGGMIYVFRHNDVTGMNIDGHGFCSAIGTREMEISNNKFRATPSGLWAIIQFRGGTGVVYNNIVESPYPSRGIYFREDRAPSASPSCTGISNYNERVNQNIYGNWDCPSYEGWPCTDQVGRGKNQNSDPLYIWGNPNWPTNANDDPTYIQAGRDYYINQGAKPGYVGYQYPNPLTGEPCIENCGKGQTTSSIPNPPSQLQVN
ncbi:MAG: hypothetical protein A2W22_01650 [Candidatus Levybacteria bacterium RBG_16_35_11]|nr:MAG: hypothetical protein A2W22_01650 [Candidatus Levybacteria bacterium RBG_16_35_11]